ncbi:MAG: hypothetical protein ACXIVF_20090 [Rhizobiaceae bacterium]
MNSWHHLPDLYFLHIPKTAGTSVRMLLEGLFPASRILPVHHLKSMEALPDDDIVQARFASGHFGWRLVERAEALGKRFEVLTFLREPAALRVSGMQYVADVPEEALSFLTEERAQLMRERITASRQGRFEEIIARDDFDPQNAPPLSPQAQKSANMLVRFLVGPGLQADDPVNVDEQTVELAKDRLLTTAFGLVEEMEKSWAVICARLGLPLLVGSLNRANTSSKRLQPSDAFMALIRHHNRYDDALYRFACEELDSLYSRMTSVDADIAGALRAAFLTKDQGLPRVGKAEITMADGLVAEGFAKRLEYEPIGRWIRWARKEATLYLPLDTSAERQIRFEIATTMNREIRDGLRLSVNGRDIPLKRSYEIWQDDAHHLICEARIPPQAMDSQAQYTALDFHAPEEVETEYPNAMGTHASFALANIRVD